ncbi:MAG: hypothetical protein ACI9CE_001714 [Flavobacterium sp.]|jgi:hypothetical protein
MSCLIAVKKWVETVVIDLELCPFARRKQDQIRYFHSDASNEENLLNDLHRELNLMEKDMSIETTLLVHPNILQSFDDYNQFLDVADALLEHLDLIGVFQIASFHPQYQFSLTASQDAENYSNRSPYPMLHILRESSLESAITSFGDTAGIPERNIEHLNKLGTEKMKKLLARCMTE